MANPDLIVFDSHVNKPGKQFKYHNKQVEIRKGAKFGSIVVTGGTLKIAGEIDIAEIVVDDPRDAEGKCADGWWLGGVSGYIGSISTWRSQRDMGKIGSETHDLTIDKWYGRAVKLEDTDFPPGHPPHRDGIQCMSGHRITIVEADVINDIPGATNGGIFLQPNKASDDVDQTDPTLVTDFVLLGGTITFPNSAINLGYCTNCGARNTTLRAQRPFRVGQGTINPIDDHNLKVLLDI